MTITSRIHLVELMRHLNLPLVAVEVGVAEGRLSRSFLEWGIKKLYLVDVWEKVPFIKGCASFDNSWHTENYESCLKVQQDFPDRDVVLLKGFSYKMADEIPNESVGLVYIDGDHTYEGARADIDCYLPKLVKGGIMAFHDAKNPTYGVEAAIWDFTKGVGINELVEDGNIENMGAYIIKQ